MKQFVFTSCCVLGFMFLSGCDGDSSTSMRQPTEDLSGEVFPGIPEPTIRTVVPLNAIADPAEGQPGSLIPEPTVRTVVPLEAIADPAEGQPGSSISEPTVRTVVPLEAIADPAESQPGSLIPEPTIRTIVPLEAIADLTESQPESTIPVPETAVDLDPETATGGRYTASFKAKVALEALTGAKSSQHLAEKYKIEESEIDLWTTHLREHAASVFSAKPVELID